MRNEKDFLSAADDQQHNIDFKKELTKLNKHVRGNYVVLNRTKSVNPDGDA